MALPRPDEEERRRFLLAIDGVTPLAVCSQVVSQAPQHLRHLHQLIFAAVVCVYCCSFRFVDCNDGSISVTFGTAYDIIEMTSDMSRSRVPMCRSLHNKTLVPFSHSPPPPPQTILWGRKWEMFTTGAQAHACEPGVAVVKTRDR